MALNQLNYSVEARRDRAVELVAKFAAYRSAEFNSRTGQFQCFYCLGDFDSRVGWSEYSDNLDQDIDNFFPSPYNISLENTRILDRHEDDCLWRQAKEEFGRYG